MSELEGATPSCESPAQGRPLSCPLAREAAVHWGGVFLPNSTVSGELGIQVSQAGLTQASLSHPRCQNPWLLLWMENWKGSTLSPRAPQSHFSLGPGLGVPLLLLKVWRWDLPKHCQGGHSPAYTLGSFSPLFPFATTSKSVHSVVLHPVIISDPSRTRTTATTYPNISPSCILTCVVVFLQMIRLYHHGGPPPTYNQQQVPDPQLPDHRTAQTHNLSPGSALQGYVLFYPGLLKNKSQLKGFLTPMTSLGGAIPGNEREGRQGWGKVGKCQQECALPSRPLLGASLPHPRFAGQFAEEMQKGPPLSSLSWVRREKIPTTSFVIWDLSPLCCLCIGGPRDSLYLCVNRIPGAGRRRYELVQVWADRTGQRPLERLTAGDLADASEALEQGQGRGSCCADVDGAVHHTTWHCCLSYTQLSTGPGT